MASVIGPVKSIGLSRKATPSAQLVVHGVDVKMLMVTALRAAPKSMKLTNLLADAFTKSIILKSF